MKITDYSKIAKNYDKNILRHEIPKDMFIEELYSLNNINFTVLDLSCGTGNYLVKQILEYPKNKYNINWIGIDKSEDMLQMAKFKNIDAKLKIADVINLPLEDNSVNYLKNRFAFHHYMDKEKAANEMYRILKQNGRFNLITRNKEYMHYSWVYKYFPTSIEIDNERFLKTSDYYEIFENSGFIINIDIEIKLRKYLYKDIIEEVKNKDMSQLNLITDDEYISGLNKMENDSRNNESILGDYALMTINGFKL